MLPTEREAKNQLIDIVEAAAKGKGIPVGEHALELLQHNNLSPLSKCVALLVRTREAIKANPPR